MRNLISIACAGLVACACYADQNPDTRTVLVTTITNTTSGTNTINNLRGYMDEVYVSCSDGISTATVYLAYVPLDGITPAVNVATGVVTAAKLWRTDLDRTDIAGADLTNDPPARPMLAGESMRMIVLGTVTGVTWTATIKLDKR